MRGLHMKIAALFFFVVLIGAVLWFGWQYYEYKRLTSSYLDRVIALRASAEVQVPSVLSQELERNLNVPPEAKAIRITQQGVIRTSLDGAWQDFEAEQTIALERSGFVWLATVPIFAGQGVEVIDSFDGQAGLLQVQLLGAITLDRFEGAEADSAQLKRYLAELPMVPGVIGRNANLAYEVQSDGSVRIWDKAIGKNIWVEALLDEQGRIREVRTDGRARGIKDGTVMTPWGGAFSDWVVIDGYDVPRYGEVWWIIDGKKKTYWRGQIISVTALDKAGKPIVLDR